MLPIPADIFTEPDDVSPDALANLGPLRHRAGVWQADKGVDVNPKAAGPERRVFREHIRMDPIDPQANGPQLFYGLRYHIHINTPEEDITFHDQVGYWLWAPADNTIVETFTIPRGLAVVAGGTLAPAADPAQQLVFEVAADASSPQFGIVQAPFMFKQAKTTAFTHTLTVTGDEMSYSESTILDIYGKKSYDHKDVNTLRRVR